MKEKQMKAKKHYDLLIDENNDPVFDPPQLKEYMGKWDGEPFIQKLELTKEKTVLEIGVGTGRIALKTAPLCRSFCGIDISPKTVTRAKENLSSLPNVNLICADFLKHPFKESFDIIYSSLTFMHIKNKKKCIKKISRLLNEKGIFVLSVDKSKNKHLDYANRKIKLYPDDPEKIRKYIKSAGLSLIKEQEIEFANIFLCQKI
jgi:ubiquinone/menaquinone biosynthesis C-methylase UbiE